MEDFEEEFEEMDEFEEEEDDFADDFEDGYDLEEDNDFLDDNIVDFDEDEADVLTDRLRDVPDVLLVLTRRDHRENPGAVRRHGLLFEPADGEDAPT